MGEPKSVIKRKENSLFTKCPECFTRVICGRLWLLNVARKALLQLSRKFYAGFCIAKEEERSFYHQVVVFNKYCIQHIPTRMFLIKRKELLQCIDVSSRIMTESKVEEPQ